MKKVTLLSMVWAMVMVVAMAEDTYTIPKDKIDKTKIAYGNPASFKKPAHIAYETILKATPEYKEIKDLHIDRSTGRYWVLFGKASERVLRAIKKVGIKTDYDLIVLDDYLEKLTPTIKSDDITDKVIETMNEQLDE